jgi:hypothetical protein
MKLFLVAFKKLFNSINAVVKFKYPCNTDILLGGKNV